MKVIPAAMKKMLKSAMQTPTRKTSFLASKDTRNSEVFYFRFRRGVMPYLNYKACPFPKEH